VMQPASLAAPVDDNRSNGDVVVGLSDEGVGSPTGCRARADNGGAVRGHPPGVAQDVRVVADDGDRGGRRAPVGAGRPRDGKRVRRAIAWHYDLVRQAH